MPFKIFSYVLTRVAHNILILVILLAFGSEIVIIFKIWSYNYFTFLAFIFRKYMTAIA